MTDAEALWRELLKRPTADPLCMLELLYADAVEDTDPARAELIRLQAQLARHTDGWKPENLSCVDIYLDPQDDEQQAWKHELWRLQKRENDLLSKANRERWEPVCVACGGTGWVTFGDGVTFLEERCRTCNGTGRQPCRWERGFPVVQVAEMRQAWEQFGLPPEYHGKLLTAWQPKPWLRGLLVLHVAAVVPRAVPCYDNVRNVFRWWLGDDIYTPASGQHSVPPPVYRHCADEYASPELATDALGRAVVLAALEWLDAR